MGSIPAEGTLMGAPVFKKQRDYKNRVFRLRYEGEAIPGLGHQKKFERSEVSLLSVSEVLRLL